MERSIIDNLPDILKNSTDTLENISCDYSNNKNNKNKQYMTNSQKRAINFDEVKNLYNIENSNAFELKSNDALYITKNNIHYFIEFKNGYIIETTKNITNQYVNIRYNLKQKLQLKMYDSIFILSDIKYSDGSLYIDKYKNNNGVSITNIIDFSKNYIEYILVYNSKKNGQLKNKSHWKNKGRINLLGLFGLSKFEKNILREIYIYDKKEFEKKFINGIIANES